MGKPNINAIMSQWRGGKPPVASAAKPPMPKAQAVKKPALQRGGVPGMLQTRNNLANMRKDTLPKGFK